MLSLDVLISLNKVPELLLALLCHELTGEDKKEYLTKRMNILQQIVVCVPDIRHQIKHRHHLGDAHTGTQTLRIGTKS